MGAEGGAAGGAVGDDWVQASASAQAQTTNARREVFGIFGIKVVPVRLEVGFIGLVPSTVLRKGAGI